MGAETGSDAGGSRQGAVLVFGEILEGRKAVTISGGSAEGSMASVGGGVGRRGRFAARGSSDGCA